MLALTFFFCLALVAMVFACGPQLTMPVANPVYGCLSMDTERQWIANVIWTPLAGAPLCVAGRHGWPVVVQWLLAVWALLGAPVVGATFATWLLHVRTCPTALRQSRRLATVGLVVWAISLFLVFPIPDGILVECGFR